MAKIDDEGFIEITGRLSRFSKIGGEMVPHLRIEEALLAIVEGDTESRKRERPEPTGEAPDSPTATTELKLVVTAVPDEKKGERIIVLHRPLGRPIAEIVKDLEQSGLPNLWLPSRDSFIEVEEIPVLGTGKLDLQAVQRLAREKTGTARPAAATKDNASSTPKEVQRQED
ncbi:MAG: hypothetical protein KY476_24985, partial [Planctomycetes bacterium]|nr:hypothetical protein [Planctomycetota bacterium]